MNALLAILKRRDIDNPSNFLISPEGKKGFPIRRRPTISRAEVERRFKRLRYL